MRAWAALLALLLSNAPACLVDSDVNDGGNGAPRTGYPAGPYGVAEGAVIEALSFVDTQGAAYGLQQIYADGNNRLLLASTAAFWCVACIEEQPDLQQLYETYRGRGFAVLLAVFEDDQYQPTDGTDAARWRTQYAVDFTVVADPTFLFDAYYDSSLTPMNMLIDVGTMKIIRIQTGWDKSAVEALIEAKL